MIGLLGLVVGFVGNAWWQHYREAGQKTAETRQALRLVGAEIDKDSDALWVLDQHRIGVPGTLQATVWNRERAVLARDLPEAQWRELDSFYSEVDWFQNVVIDEPYVPLSDADLAGVRDTRLAGDRILRKLGVVRGPVPAWFYQRRDPYRPDPLASKLWWPDFVRRVSPVLFPSTAH
jgi:hypothetical protein